MINIKSNFLKDLLFGCEDGFRTSSKFLRAILILILPIRFVLMVIFMACALTYFFSCFGLLIVIAFFCDNGGEFRGVGWGIIIFNLLLLLFYIKAKINDDY